MSLEPSRSNEFVLPISRPAVRPKPGPRRGLLYVGTTLVLIYILQAALDLPPLIAEDARNAPTFRAISGAMLLAYLLSQLYLPYLRFVGDSGRARGHLSSHELTGVLGPLLLYLHAPHPTAGYLTVLPALLLGNVAAALLNPRSLGIKGGPWWFAWLMVHIATSVFLVGLSLFHVGHALYYE